MTETTSSAVLVAPRTIEMQEFPVPATGADDGLLRVEGTGICGADWEPYANGGKERYPFRHLFPWILGHEIVGTVERLGPVAAKKWGVSEGDRVILEEVIPCGHCRLCRTGWYRGCTDVMYPDRHGEGKFYGMTPVSEPPHLWGGYGEYVYLHPNAILHPMPLSVSTENAPLFIPIANGLDWIEQSGESVVGETVVILGPGQHGLGCVIGAKESGAKTVIIVGQATDTHRLDVALQLGADHALVAGECDLAAEVVSLTDGDKAAMVMDITPSPEALNQSLDLVRTRGTVVLGGFKTGKPVENFMSDKLLGKRLIGAVSHAVKSVSRAIDIIASGRYPLDLMSTHHFPLSQVDDALLTVGGEGDPDAIHVTIVPDDAPVTGASRATTKGDSP